MFSAYLNKEVELKVAYATGCGGKKHPIVYHSDLEDFILGLGSKIRYEYPAIIPGLEDAVVTCSMWDDEYHRVTAVGEATPNTLNSSVAQCFPTTTAANRAFDRAAIRFLRLKEEGYGQVYSNLEMAPDGPKNYDEQNLTDAPMSNLPADDIEANVVVDHQSHSETTSAQTAAIETPVVNPAAQSCSQVDEGGSAQNDGDDASVLISLGKYSSKPATVAEIFENDQAWFMYITKNLTPKKPEYVTQLECMKRYLAAQEGK